MKTRVAMLGSIGLLTLVIQAIFLLVVPVAQAQDWRTAFPADVHDNFSGVVLVEPPPGPHMGPSGPETFGTDVLVNPVTTNPQNETTFAVNKWIDNLLGVGRFFHNAGFNDYRNSDSRCGASVSKNGGTSYLDAGLVPLIPNRPDLLVAGDPALAWSLQGYVYYACLYFSRSTGNGTVAVSKSTNGGASYPAPVLVANGSSTIFNDKEFIAVDTSSRSPFQGRVYVCWTEFVSLGPAAIKLKRSENEGATWLPAAGVTLSSSVSNQGCDVAVGPDGDVYVVWLDSAGGNNSNGVLRVRRSTDGGVSFGATVVITPVSGPTTLPSPGAAYRINNFPRIATDRQGHVFVVFSTTGLCAGTASTGLDICLWRASAALGTVGFAKVNRLRTAEHQHFPAIAVSDNPSPSSTISHGKLHVCYIDRSYTAGGFWDTSCAHSDTSDGPDLTWLAPVRVSACSSSLGFFGGGGFIGDYIGMDMSVGTAAGPDVLGVGHIHPVFPRSCTNEQNIFSDAGTPTAPPAP
jgi:hypothetical protein